MRALPDFEAWAIFAIVAEEGSFARAAQRLGISQATVSKAISRLEESTESTLLHRTPRQMSLTNTGEAVLGQAIALLEQGNEIEINIAEQTKRLVGPIRVSAPMSFGASSLAPILPKFMNKHPGVELNVHFDDRFIDIIAERFDLAIRITNLEDSSLLARQLCTIDVLLVASPEYIKKNGEPKHPKDLIDHKVLLYVYHRHGATWQFFNKNSGRFSQSLPPPVMQVNNAEGMLPALKAGMGLALLPDFLVWDDIQAGLLKQVMPQWQADNAALSVVLPPGRKRPARVNAFIDFLVEELERVPWRGS